MFFCSRVIFHDWPCHSSAGLRLLNAFRCHHCQRSTKTTALWTLIYSRRYWCRRAVPSSLYSKTSTHLLVGRPMSSSPKMSETCSLKTVGLTRIQTTITILNLRRMDGPLVLVSFEVHHRVALDVFLILTNLWDDLPICICIFRTRYFLFAVDLECMSVLVRIGAEG